MSPPLLEISDLTVDYGVGRGAFRAVDGVSLTIPTGGTVALVGESGSGKSSIGRAIVGLARVTAGRILFDEVDIANLTPRARRPLSKEIQVVFQDPVGSLNPSLAVGRILSEPLRVHGVSRRDSERRVRELLDRVGLPADSVRRHPGEFSGGQRQRIAIARALALSPRLIVCDEPTSALDVSTQARVLELLRELQHSLGIAYLFISHDLAVVREISDQVLVMRQGVIVERGQTSDVCDRPTHPYTQRLVQAAPVPDPRVQARRRRVRWDIANA